ncbi:hypothetical protein F8271_06515 [Micromonospora sp. ALFpr18c]|uniref:hypothetical protein n=1 Tax=unclassified Micromonospora TaxID=2617518 RepID=UPI00124B488B|nr:hypothetical protein [Micromonospora sp. ALFpr18c]KAB1946487.1 hypothetical protein F8271_06515 [Micromonospora sp. ALFpr18c]
MDVVPEIVKSWTGRSRYEALVGNAQGLALLLDGVSSLIKACEPPAGAVYQFAARVEDLEDAHKQTVDVLRAFMTRVKTYEADLIAKPWKVN